MDNYYLDKQFDCLLGMPSHVNALTVSHELRMTYESAESAFQNMIWTTWVATLYYGYAAG